MNRKERQRLKSVERSRKAAAMKTKKKERSESDIERLERYKRRLILFRKFNFLRCRATTERARSA